MIEFFDRGNLSEQCLAFFATNDDGGNSDQRIQWALANGLYKEDDCIYDWRENGINNIPNLSRKTKIWPTGSYIYQRQDMTDPIAFIKNKIDSGLPVTIAVYVAGDDWTKQKIIAVPSEDDIENSCRKNTKSSPIKKCAGHEIIVTGYNDDLGYLEFKNSWGVRWPEGPNTADGYGKLSYAYYLKMRKGLNNMVTR